MLVVLLALLGILNLSAEYRVYLLDIKVDKGVMKNGEKIIVHKLVLSNLDHVQYPAWYGLRNDQAETLDSWMCWGDNSGFKKPCQKRSPAAEVVNAAD